MAFLRRLKGAYDHLAAALPAVAREADGSTNERAAMQLLTEQGLELSLDGCAIVRLARVSRARVSIV